MHEARKEHGLLPDLLRIREPGFLHQGTNSVFGVVREARVGMKQTGQETMRAGLSTSDRRSAHGAGRVGSSPSSRAGGQGENCFRATAW